MKNSGNEINDMQGLVESMLAVSQDSTVYKKIAAYVEKYYMKIIFMTAEEMADALSVSQGSVSKFCIALGYRGYADFLRSLQKLVSQEITAPERYTYTSGTLHHTDDLIDTEIENIRALKEITAGKEYETLAANIAAAGEVVLISARMSATVLPYMKYIADKLRENVTVVTPGQNTWDYLCTKNKEKTFFVAVGFPRYPRILKGKMEELHKEGFNVGLITDSRFSPLCRYAQTKVFVPVTVASIFDVYSTPIAFINILMTDVSKKIPKVKNRLALIEKQEAASKTYFS